MKKAGNANLVPVCERWPTLGASAALLGLLGLDNGGYLEADVARENPFRISSAVCLLRSMTRVVFDHLKNPVLAWT
jgi:hypothetical protein